MLPDFNRLKIFYYIYSTKSISDAANSLHLTQSCISQHLKKLEYEVRIPLFTRLNRKLVPTAAGDKLFSVIFLFLSFVKPCLTTNPPFKPTFMAGVRQGV